MSQDLYGNSIGNMRMFWNKNKVVINFSFNVGDMAYRRYMYIKLTLGPGTEGNVDIQLNPVWFESYFGKAPNVPSYNIPYIPVEALWVWCVTYLKQKKMIDMYYHMKQIQKDCKLVSKYAAS